MENGRHFTSEVRLCVVKGEMFQGTPNFRIPSRSSSVGSKIPSGLTAISFTVAKQHCQLISNLHQNF